MNKKRFKRELSNLCKNRAVTSYYIEQFFRTKKSFFNDEKVEVLIKDNYEQMLKGTPKGNMNLSINALYAHPEMREFMERDDSIKLVLDTAAYYDFRDIVFDSDISARAQKFINDNFDYFASNAELKKMVSIFEYVDLTEENKDKMHEYFKGHKEGFLKEILTMTLSIRGNLNEKESDALLKIVTSIVDKAMEHEHAKVMDIKKLLVGSYSSVIRVGDTIVKVGTPRKTFDMPNDERILQPHLRRDLQKELGIAAVIEVADRVDTDFKITEEEMYEVYRDMRERGVVCGDFKYGNIGKLLRDNPPRNNERHGLHGNVTKTLKAGEYVVIDTDFFYKENDPKTELSSDLSIQFEKRYRREKGLDIEAKKETEVKKEMQVSPVKKGR
jgi:hypothetical protein